MAKLSDLRGAGGAAASGGVGTWTPTARWTWRGQSAAFQEFFREHSDPRRASQRGVQRFERYHEAGPQLLLQAHLQRIANGSGRIEREYALRRGRTDLLIVWPHGGRERRFVVECKVLRKAWSKRMATWTAAGRRRATRSCSTARRTEPGRRRSSAACRREPARRSRSGECSAKLRTDHTVEAAPQAPGVAATTATGCWTTVAVSAKLEAWLDGRFPTIPLGSL